MAHHSSIQKSQHRKAVFCLLIGVCILGLSAVLIKAAHAPGIVTAFYRMTIGVLGLLIPFILHRRRNPQWSKKGMLFAIAAGLCFGCDMSFWSTAIVATNATLPTVAANLAPIWAGLGAMVIFKEKIGKGFWFGILIAIVGIVVMVFNDFFKANGILLGVFYGMMAGFFYGMYYLVTQKGRLLLATLDFLFISTLTSALFLLLMMFVFNYPFGGYDQYTVTIFVAYGLLVQVAGWWLINFSQGHLKAVVVSPVLLGQPVATVVVAYFVLNETHTPIQLVGGAIVIIGIYLVYFTRLRQNR